MKKWYGSLSNRMEEGRMFCDKITVGTPMTEYSYSDRQAYEVVDVIDQKHVSVRRLDHIAIGDTMSNTWKLVSNNKNVVRPIVRRGDNWYWVKTATKEQVNSDNPETRLWVVVNGFDYDKIMRNGSQTKYSKANVSFGKAEYYFDYEF